MDADLHPGRVKTLLGKNALNFEARVRTEDKKPKFRPPHGSLGPLLPSPASDPQEAIEGGKLP